MSARLPSWELERAEADALAVSLALRRAAEQLPTDLRTALLIAKSDADDVRRRIGRVLAHLQARTKKAGQG